MAAAAAAMAGEGHGGAAQGRCLDCGTPLVGAHCHACGQAAHLHRSLGAIWHDLAHGAFHFEGRIWRTLPMLVRRPGALTRRYIDGERTRFVSPLALFLFIVFVLFAMLSIGGVHLEAADRGSAEARGVRQAIESSIARNGEQVSRLVATRARATTPRERTRIDAAIAERDSETAAMRATLAAIDPGGIRGLDKVRTGWKRLDKGIAKAAGNPNLILYKLQSNAYKFAWALVPLSLPFLWLLFPFSRRFSSYDHAVFVTYSLCFNGLFLLAISLLGMAGAGATWLFLAGGVIVPLHMYKQLRGTYALGRFGAFWRMVVLFVGANVAVVIFALLLVGLGLVG